MTVLAIILAAFSLSGIIILFVIVKSRVALIISMSSIFGLLENVIKIFIVFMSLDSWVSIAVATMYSVNVILGIQAINIFNQYSEMGYEEWEEYNQLVSTKKSPRMYNFW